MEGRVKIILIKTPDKDSRFEKSEVRIEINARDMPLEDATTGGLLDEIESFLRAIGYNFNGSLSIVDE